MQSFESSPKPIAVNNNINDDFDENFFSFKDKMKDEDSIEFNSYEDLEYDEESDYSKNTLVEPPRATGFLMKFIFLFHPYLLILFILPGILTFWIMFISGENSLKPFIYIVFIMVPLLFQIILLAYHSRSFLFLNYGRQAISRKYNNLSSNQFGQLYQLVDVQTQSVITLLDSRIADEKAMYLYIPITKEVFNMSYFESTFKINALGHWKVVMTWKSLLSFFVCALILVELVLLIVLKSWFFQMFK
ncbi:hypothetical protein DLAC_07347 [Tieghemostelium lacteum]|uniref:Transmembrane protein n=1 Tax=Tieghemostelium lacteum TaxID=361077 RepID=A0A151ZCA1_TIELA|nr:hypothetical protein DLAC_07347 [Tieghemostelium lacteum]|eukprot:KYQ91577.1 hypothetical protein DLAC_07347 [Tieghemostelium lacteum]